MQRTDAVYCGPPPGPETLWAQWNFDPVLLAAMAAAVALWWFRLRGPDTGRLAFAAGMAVLLIAFVSPLCALSSALFSARVGHHMLMVAVAAPLLAWGLPRITRRIPLTLAGAAHAVTLWLWHAPGAYDWALSHPAAYWVMELTLLAGALLFWAALRARLAAPGAVILALLAVMAQMGLLAALITFAPSPLYAAHAAAPFLWGLTPLQDQQLAGLIMWAPAALPYLAASVWAGAAWMGRLERAGAISWRG